MGGSPPAHEHLGKRRSAAYRAGLIPPSMLIRLDRPVLETAIVGDTPGIEADPSTPDRFSGIGRRDTHPPVVAAFVDLVVQVP